MLSHVPQRWRCTACKWSGDYTELVVELLPREPYPTCPECAGHRFTVHDLPPVKSSREICWKCKGAGTIEHRCDACGGEGMVQ